MSSTARTRPWSPIRAIRAAGVEVRIADIAWFAYEPTHRRITLARRLDDAQRLEALALALAHHTLGHHGNSESQDEAAGDLAAFWLGSLAS